MMRAYAPEPQARPARARSASSPASTSRRVAGERVARARRPDARRTEARRVGGQERRTPAAARSARARGEQRRQPLASCHAGRRRRGRSSAGRGRCRRSGGRAAPPARRTPSRRRRSSGSAGPRDPDSSALRRAQATAGRDPSTWVTARPGRGADERHRAGVGEEVAGRWPAPVAARPLTHVADPGPVRGLLREQPDLAGRRRAELEPEVAIRDLPRVGDVAARPPSSRVSRSKRRSAVAHARRSRGAARRRPARVGRRRASPNRSSRRPSPASRSSYRVCHGSASIIARNRRRRARPYRLPGGAIGWSIGSVVGRSWSRLPSPSHRVGVHAGRRRRRRAGGSGRRRLRPRALRPARGARAARLLTVRVRPTRSLSFGGPSATMRRAIGPESGRGDAAGEDWNASHSTATPARFDADIDGQVPTERPPARVRVAGAARAASSAG